MKSLFTLINEYRQFAPSTQVAHKLDFIGVDGSDVYNTSIIFKLGQKSYIAGRVETRMSEHSQVRLFEQINEYEFKLVPEFSLTLQDPFVTLISGKVILGGVKVRWNEQQVPTWHTEFYELDVNLITKLILSGPTRMKDIRLCELNDGKVLILTRPQGGKAGLGKIGLLIVDDLTAVTAEQIDDAPLLVNNFNDDNWGGANQIFQVSNNVIFVAGHIASMVNDERHYCALGFYVDIKGHQIFGERILAERQNFLAGPSKRDDLADVVFTSGIIKNDDNLLLFCGTSDCEEQFLEISQDTI